MNLFWVSAIILIALKLAAQLWLEWLNRRHVLAHAAAVPEAFKTIVDEGTYRKTVDYTLAKSKLHQIELIYGAVVLVTVLFSGLLPWGFDRSAQFLGTTAWAQSAFLIVVAITLSLPELPLDWYAQFHLEEQFGFNTLTPRLWWIDRCKALALGLVLGFPLLLLILKLTEWAGAWWWLGAWGALMAFQLLMSVLAPVLILPLFNKFTPLPDGELRQRLLKLAERTQFRARSIQVMDGSKRSRHSNAFFTGFGGFRKIVLFDTLIQQLAESEIEAVLAHEIGHFKKKHIPKMLLAAACGSLLGFYALAWLAQQNAFLQGFGFTHANFASTLLLFGLLSSVVTFWFSPIAHWWSRRYEYQADAFAAFVMGEPGSLVGALRKLNEKNLSNLTPHPVYSGFYYSHPALLEREAALAARSTGSPRAQ